MDDSSSKVYRPTTAARALVVTFALPGALLIGWVGTTLLHQTFAWGIVALLISALSCIWIIFIITSRVTLTRDLLERTWQLGTCAIPIDAISKLEWGGSRGQLNLVVKTGKTYLILSSLSFKEQELRELTNGILTARGLEAQPLWPPHTKVIDVEAMVKNCPKSVRISQDE